MLSDDFAQDNELMYVLGRWKYKDGTAGYRITRIYVSSKASTENGTLGLPGFYKYPHAFQVVGIGAYLVRPH